jgi:hypothetical protein
MFELLVEAAGWQHKRLRGGGAIMAWTQEQLAAFCRRRCDTCFAITIITEIQFIKNRKSSKMC